MTALPIFRAVGKWKRYHYPDLSFLPPEELSRLLEKGLQRIERRHAAAVTHNDAVPTSATVIEDSEKAIEVGDNSPPPSATGDPLATPLALFDELLAALEQAIESGQWLDYGSFVLAELERIRGDLETCRLLVCDGRSAPASLG